ncbi:hypothetical protein J6590_024888 [Homalodisca vitripennis]|nr:hypothetical protein J6590_024888 [Homalodisca vitripennis]
MQDYVVLTNTPDAAWHLINVLTSTSCTPAAAWSSKRSVRKDLTRTPKPVDLCGLDVAVENKNWQRGSGTVERRGVAWCGIVNSLSYFRA